MSDKPVTLMVSVSALSAEIAAVAAENAANEMRRVFVRNPLHTDLLKAADAQEFAAKELREAVAKAVRS